MQNTVSKSKSMKKNPDLRRYKVANFACFEKSNQENKAIMKFQWKWRHEVNMKEISLQSFTKFDFTAKMIHIGLMVWRIYLFCTVG